METAESQSIRTKSIFFFVFLNLVFISQIYTEDQVKYQWPLKIFNGLSATFQEYRGGHFHAGLDLKTYQKTGYPVHAISDGEIYKIRVVKRGSGRALFLKHKDQRVSTYFHLDRFEQKLENILRSVQKKKGKKYFGNYFLTTKLFYKKGEIIGFSGQTGSGYPHLHVEVRDEKYRAVNSLPFFEYPGNDIKLPVIRAAIFKPFGRSLIDGEIGSHFFKFISDGTGNYKLEQPLIITGAFDIILNTFDVNDSGHRVSPYNIIASIDGTPYFEIQNDLFIGDDNNQIGFMFDLFKTSSSFYFYNLFFQKGFDLEKRKTYLNDVINNLQLGRHRLSIKVTDYFGNFSTGNIPFTKVKNPVISVGNIELEKGSIVISIKEFDCTGSDKIEVRLLDEQFAVLFKGSMDSNEVILDRNLRLNVHNEDVKFVQFKIKKNESVYFEKKFSINSAEWSENKDVVFETIINRDDIYIKIINKKITSENIALKVIQGSDELEIDPNFSKDGIYFVFKPLNSETDLMLNFSLKNNGKIYSKMSKNIKIIPLEFGKTQNFQWDEFEAYFAKKSVREPRNLLVKKVLLESKFPILSTQFDLSPYHFPFLDIVNYKIKKEVPKPFQVSIFKYNHKRKRWGAVYSIYNKAKNTFSRKLRSSGTFALMRDIFPPKIKFYKPKRKKIKSVKFLTVILTDRGKGINDNTIEITLNGKQIEDEFDPDWSRVRIKDLSALRKGKNVITIKVRDYAKHETKKIYTFSLR